MKNFENQAKTQWGDTDAYREYAQKTASYSQNRWQAVNDALMAIFSEFAECRNGGYNADSHNVQALVKKLQNYITENYYTCTNEILAGLGKMYTADSRFSNNIDKNGIGTAEFVSDAIKFYCKGAAL